MSSGSETLMMLHEWPTAAIVMGLLVAMSLANEAGFHIGRQHAQKESEHSRSASNSLKGSVFALVALLLAFSFSATAARYELRQRLVLDQANAIGTCYLRAGLLDDVHRDRVQEILRQYIDVRLESFRAAQQGRRHERMQREIDQRLAELWSAVEEANRQQPEVVRNSMIVQAANDVIDLSSTRAWANRNHLPDPVLALLLVGVVVSSLLLGHSSGQARRRHPGLWLASNVVFALVLYVVLDFDRPRRGLIRIDPTPIVELRESFPDSTAP
jgi:hypothetical protein